MTTAFADVVACVTHSEEPGIKFTNLSVLLPACEDNQHSM